MSPNFSILYEMENVVLFEKILARRSMFIFTWIYQEKCPHGMLKKKKKKGRRSKEAEREQ